MTTENIIATLKQGVPVTARLVREIIVKLERLDWAERSLKAALESYGAEKVQLTRDECGYVCDALEECERLKEAVRVMMRAQRQGVSAHTAAKKAVEGML